MKPLFWIGSSRRDLGSLPENVKLVTGYAIYLAQIGGRHSASKPLKGFGDTGVLEVVSDFHGDAYRVVYTIRHPGAIYVLHALQKRSTRGIRTPQNDMAIVRQRLKLAERHHAQCSE